MNDYDTCIKLIKKNHEAVAHELASLLAEQHTGDDENEDLHDLYFHGATGTIDMSPEQVYESLSHVLGDADDVLDWLEERVDN